MPYAGYGGWDWRRSGDEEYRQTTGLVCQPTYAIHSFWGCHFRCAYCNLGHVANIYVNLEEWVEHIAEGLANLENAPDQKLFQWNNGTDVVCWEPEYGGSKMLIDLFARQPDKYLELYVGKSEKAEFLDSYRLKMYRLVLDEVARKSPRTPVALCREKRRVWDALADDMNRMGQTPDDYVCNCGPVSAGCDRRLQEALA